MSAFANVLKYAKDLILIAERLDTLTRTVAELSRRVEDQQRSIIRLEAILEVSMRFRLPPVESVVNDATDRNTLTDLDRPALPR